MTRHKDQEVMQKWPDIKVRKVEQKVTSRRFRALVKGMSWRINR